MKRLVCRPPIRPALLSDSLFSRYIALSRSRFSSCSPDFGVGGVSDRLGQISPKIVFFSLGYLYSGRWFDCRKLALDVLARLPGTCLSDCGGGCDLCRVFLCTARVYTSDDKGEM